MLRCTLLLAAVLCGGSACLAEGERLVNVADFGAVPDDGACDAAAIRSAIASAQGHAHVRLVFKAGVYNLAESSVVERSGKRAMLHLWNLDDWTIEGAVDAAGDPATVLEMNLKLRNKVTGARHLDIRDCHGLTVKNLVIDQNPRMATAARVVNVNRRTGQVKIRMFDGMPHFDGMASFSANNWDLATRQLIQGPPVTIGTDASRFGTWSAVTGSPGCYMLRNKAIAKLLKVGEGLSFHFNVVSPQGRAIDAYRSSDLVFENIFVYNALGMVMGAGDNHNMTFRRFHIKPEGNSLAVGPRDGLHINCSSGRLLMDDVVVRGVRWDPIVSYMHSASVAERIDDQSIRLDLHDSKAAELLKALKVGSQMHFWCGSDPSVRTIARIDGGRITFTAPLDPSARAGAIVTPGEWHWQEAIIRNSTIESNYGTAIVFENDNLLVEHCVLRNNAYSAIGLGPTSTNAGMFCRHVVIRNNLFETSTWQAKYGGSPLGQQRGAITLFNQSDHFSTQAYHRDILIENNVFRDLTGRNKPAAIDIKLARQVIVRNNRCLNVAHPILVDAATTSEVSLEEPSAMQSTSP